MFRAQYSPVVKMTRLPGSVGFFLAAAFLMQPAMAQERPPQERSLMLRLGGTVAWDDNVFRVPDSAPDPQLARGISGKSDRFSTTYVGLSFDKTYSQQRLRLGVTETITRYDKFTFLDSENLAYQGEWQWHLSPHISGTISVDRNETPVPFDETRNLEANTLIATNRSFAVTASPFAGWQLLAGVRQGERKYARPHPELPDSSQSGWEAGLRYTAASQSTISVVQRSQQGEGTSQAAGTPVALGTGRFTLDETELQVAWPVSGKSTLNGRLGRIEHRYTDAPERDFSGVGGEFSHRWTPTGRLTLEFSARRSLAPFIQDTRSSYRVDDTLALAPAWQVSEKVRLHTRASRQESDFRGPVAAVTEPARRDILRSVDFTAEWSAHRKVILSGTLRRERRSSNDAQFTIDSTILRVGAALTF